MSSDEDDYVLNKQKNNPKNNPEEKLRTSQRVTGNFTSLAPLNIEPIKKKYPISKEGKQCISPCYFKNTKIIHPTTLDEIKSTNLDFCAVNPYIAYDPKLEHNSIIIADPCSMPTTKEIEINEIMRENMLAPQFPFSSEYFVKIYYKIYDLNDFLKWLDENKNIPYVTKERVFNNSIVVYGDDLNIVDHRLVYFINEMMIKYLPKIYRSIKHYFTIENDRVKLTQRVASLTHTNKNEHKYNKEQISAIRNHIKNLFFGSDNIHKFMSKIIRYYKEDIINRHSSEILVRHMIDYIIKKIHVTLEDADSNSEDSS